MKKPFKLTSALLPTIVTVGPIGWCVVDIVEGRTERLLLLFVISIILAVFDTILWCCYFSKDNTFEQEDEEDNH